MDEKLKIILENVSTKYKKDYNKSLIDEYNQKLKDILELPLYKVIHHISGNYVTILMGLEKEYLSLKAQKLEKENDHYKKLFTKFEESLKNSAIAKYPIIEEITKDTLNSGKNDNNNLIFNYMDKSVEVYSLSGEICNSFNNDINDNSDFCLSNLFVSFPPNGELDVKANL